MKKRKPKLKQRDARVAGIKARLLDIAAGLYGAQTGDWRTAIEINCIPGAYEFGNWLSALWLAFDVPADDLMRNPAMYEKLVDFDRAAEFIEQRMIVWAAPGRVTP